MTNRRRPHPCPEIVTLETQSELDRLAMMMMQLDMALAMAREKGLCEVELYLEAALNEALSARRALLN